MVGLQQPALGLQLRAALVELTADLGHGRLDRALLDVVVGRRPDRDVLEVVRDQLAGERIEVLQALDFIPEQGGAERGLRVGRKHLQRLATHAKCPA